MAILITGGAGYVGSHMVHELADRGEQRATSQMLIVTRFHTCAMVESP
ncbi:NAD-dependent epimerase/dehydratase family protein (plasmid) [Bradyrhizobium sp. CB82]|nr:NAD-dependent epimerase/dehydratase family protein [Bradyrhizobium sp. CB82]WFU45949.1 NAD-dependent epimerase/dehydratase family protein [Bradyrhizobium sp. CB82]